MRHLFSYGTTPVQDASPEMLMETPIGATPPDWSFSVLGDIAAIERGKFSHRPRNDPAFYGGEVPFIQTGDVTAADGRIIDYTQTLNERGLAVSRVFPAGTIVITIAANIGYAGILDFDAAFPDSLIGITPGDGVLNEYLNYYLLTQQPGMDRLAPRGTQKNINIRFLEPWPVPVPPWDEQKAIAEALMTVDRKIAWEEARADALAELFSSLLYELMTGRTRASPPSKELLYDDVDGSSRIEGPEGGLCSRTGASRDRLG